MWTMKTLTKVFFSLAITKACLCQVIDLNEPNIFNETETSTNFSKFIVNGKRATVGVYPWFAQVSLNSNGYLNNICGGTLINKRWILTAAHCVHDAKYAVEIGRYSDYSNNNVVYRDVNYVCQHKNFQPQTFTNDIALFRLSNPVNNIQPVDYKEFTSFYPNMPFKIIGYGATDAFQTKYASTLLEGDVFYVTNQFCSQKWVSYIDDNKICASGYGMQDACLGDSGGPLLKKSSSGWTQVGLVSFGANPCNNANFPVMYTNIYKYRSWINKVINGDYSGCD